MSKRLSCTTQWAAKMKPSSHNTIASKIRDPKAYLKDRELTEADRVVLGLYERAAESIEWDESDEAILTLSRSIHAEDEGEKQSGSLAAGATEIPADGQDLAHATETDEKDGGSNVVAFAQRKTLRL